MLEIEELEEVEELGKLPDGVDGPDEEARFGRLLHDFKHIGFQKMVKLISDEWAKKDPVAAWPLQVYCKE
jgi:hypothetical protein